MIALPQQPATKKHMNLPQLLFKLVMAQINIVLWGRATGKTEGPMAMFTLDNIYKMPRSNGFLLGTTYEQLLTRTLPPLFAAWEGYGIRQNEHFWIGRFPEQKLKIQKALRSPLKADHYIQFNNGSGIYLVSQDRPGTINGVRTQWGAGDEAKLLDAEKMRSEVLLTMAGFADHFGHLSNYLSLLFCSDMPNTSKGNWLFDYKDQVDEETINAILQCQMKILELKGLLERVGPSKRLVLQKDILKFEGYLNELRKNTVFVSLASTLDNIHALGLTAIKNFKLTLSDIEFQLSVLNKRILAVENGFYGLLSEDEHGYDSVNYDFVDTLEMEPGKTLVKDCRWDADLDRNAPLDISCDYNNAINSVVVGQERGRQYRFINTLFVKRPLLLKDCVAKFCEYYKHMNTRHVNYYYDHTAVARSASTDLSFADEWCQELEKAGWTVTKVYIGQAPGHSSRYMLWEYAFSGDNRVSTFRFNKTNSKDWQVSCQQAKVIRSGGVFKKDKSSEKDTKLPQEQATHISEAGDILWYGTQRHKIDASSHSFTDTAVVG